MYFVYYSDDYEENGGVGLERLKSEEEVIAFIESRMKVFNGKPENYTVIEGFEVAVEPVEKVRSVKLKRT